MASTDEKIFNGQDLETYSTLIKQSIENVENQIPTLTSLLINNSNFPVDANYVHTDNNYTSEEKTKLSGIEAGAEVNVLSDWNAVSGDAFIKNKPNNIVTDASYVHTDNNYTTAEKNKLAGIASGAEVNVQSDWNQITTTADDYIKNKPTNVSSFNNDAGYLTEHQDISGKLDVIPDLDTIRAGAAAGATAYQKPSIGIPKSDLSSSVLTSLGKADTALQQHQDLSSYADGAEYDSTNHLIYLKHGSTRLANPINASDFIKDGMVDTVEVTGGNLVITFNTDSGKLPITIPISDIFDANNYYTKTEIDNAGYITEHQSLANYYTKSEVDTKTAKTTARGDSKLLYNGQSVEVAISNVGFSTTNNLLNNGYNMAIRSNSTNPFFGLKEGSNLWYALAAGNYFYFGPTSTNAMRLDQSGNVVVQTGSLTANSIIKKNGTSSQFLKADGSVDSNTYLTSFTETDPTVPSWAKQSTKPSYTASEVGALPSTTFIPSKTSDLTNDSGFITGYTETDPIYSASVAAGITSSDISNWNSKTSNIGTITGITMNGTSKGTSGVVNLGTVVTSETDPVFTASAAHGITSSDITNWNNKLDSYTETDPTVPSWAKLSTKPSYNYSEINNTPTLATVATSGSYNDLSNKPTIPNVPTNVSAFTNDAGYLTTHLDISGKQDVLTAGDGIAIDNTDTIRAIGIPFGIVDSTSTKTAFTATVPGIDRLENGVCVMLKNGVVTSAAGFTININGLGAKPAFNNMTAATRETTIFNINYTMLFVYDATRVVDSITGAWVCYRGYDANTNTIGFQLRTNSTVMTVTDTARYYKIYFTSADGAHWVPASVNSTNNATSARAVNQRPINPFGRIVFTSANSNYAAGANLAATTIWDQYTLTLGYSFNRTGAALTLTTNTPVYVKCAPQTNGSAIMDADTPIVQALPTTNDGKIYIFLGVAYSATAIELVPNHPVYYHDGTGIKLWTGSTGGSADLTNYYTKTEVDTALSGKQATLVSGTNLKTINNTSLLGSGNVSVQPTLVSGTNIKTINNESLLGSGNISIEGGGSSMSITYNASTQALVIGGGSMKYTITLTGSSVSQISNITVNSESKTTSDFPMEVDEGSSLGFKHLDANISCTVTMGGTDITSSVRTSQSEGHGVIAIEYYVYDISNITGDIVVTINYAGGGGSVD